MRKKESLGELIGFLVLSVVLLLSPSHAAQSNPMTIAELTLYKGTDREKILLEGAKKEGQVVFYTSNTWVAGPVSQEFEKKYPFIKAEFWRVNPAQNCVCIDSDSRFIRDFFASDFLASDGNPYTILHEGKPFMEFCLTHGIRETERHFEAMSDEMRRLFGRVGPSYAFNPFPVIWSSKVWQALAAKLEAEGSNITGAIVAHPYESSWYGEALLKYKSVPLLPREPIFKAYLYFEEYERDRRDGMTEAMLAKFYLGVVYQSNWYPHRLKLLKRIAYKLKRRLQRYR